MKKLFLCLFLCGFLIISFSQDVPTTNYEVLLQQYRAAEYTYQQAEKTSQQSADGGMSERARQLYEQALTGFQDLLSSSETTQSDSLLFCIYLRSGNIYYKLYEKKDDVLFYYKKAEEIPDSYTYFLNENLKYYKQFRSIAFSYGLQLKRTGDQLASTGRYYEAIQQYHQAILQYDSIFTNSDVYSNPRQFTNDVPFTYLYAALIAKADAFIHLRPGAKNIKALNAAGSAYQSALGLAELIFQKNNSHEIFSLLDDISSTLGNRPINIYMELFELTRQKDYQEEAYRFDQRMRLIKLFVRNSIDPKRDPSIPSIASLQELIDKRTAIVSYSVTESELSIFVITSDNVNYQVEPLYGNFLKDIDQFRNSLAGDSGLKYEPTLSMRLYQKLIFPIEKKLKNITRLIIVPDHLMNYVTFEALQRDSKTYLLEKYSVQYQYSTAFLGKNIKRSHKHKQSVYASYPDYNNLSSFIDSIDQLRLDTAQVVIFTSTSKPYFLNNTALVFSEALSLAGCPNMITSFWQSNDAVSLFVKNRLQEYLDEGYSRDKALQLARLDLLRSNEVDYSQKTPANWANMVLIGEYEPLYHPTPWLLIAIIASVIAAVVWVVTVKSNY